MDTSTRKDYWGSPRLLVDRTSIFLVERITRVAHIIYQWQTVKLPDLELILRVPEDT